jgi:hypothetical protein
VDGLLGFLAERLVEARVPDLVADLMACRVDVVVWGPAGAVERWPQRPRSLGLSV